MGSALGKGGRKAILKDCKRTCQGRLSDFSSASSRGGNACSQKGSSRQRRKIPENGGGRWPRPRQIISGLKREKEGLRGPWNKKKH